MKTGVPVAVSFVAGLIMVVSFFFNEETTKMGGLSQELLNWLIIVGGFTLLLGVTRYSR